MNVHPAKRRLVPSASPYEPIVGFSRAVRVGNFVAVAGTTAGSGGKPVAIGDSATQTRAIIEVIEKALADVGASLKDVVRTRIYLTDILHWEAVGRVHGEFFADIPSQQHVPGDCLRQAGMAGRDRGRCGHSRSFGLKDSHYGAAQG